MDVTDHLAYTLHTLLEMLPISSSTHLALLRHVPSTAAEVLFAHGVPACVFAAPAFRVVIAGVRRKQWWYLVPWCIAGALAESITLLGYCVLYDSWVCRYMPTALGLGITSLLLLLVSFPEKAESSLAAPSLRTALYVGCAQALAFLPGISRLGVTYAVGRLSGAHHRTAFTFTCALAVPLYAGYWLQGVLDGSISGHLTLVQALGYAMLMCAAYGVLRGTEYLFVTGRAWVFAVYLAFLAAVLALRPVVSFQ